MKLKYSSEKEVLDLRTGKLVNVDVAGGVDQIKSPDRTLAAEETGDLPSDSRET
jgi:hypothetical protein